MSWPCLKLVSFLLFSSFLLLEEWKIIRISSRTDHVLVIYNNRIKETHFIHSNLTDQGERHHMTPNQSTNHPTKK